jgi:hypothetical protein
MFKCRLCWPGRPAWGRDPALSPGVTPDNGIASLCPFLVAAHERTNAADAVLPENERRTGARLLRRSTAIGDDRFLLRAQFCGASLHGLEGHEDRAWQMSLSVTLGITDVEHEHASLRLELLELLDRDT